MPSERPNSAIDRHKRAVTPAPALASGTDPADRATTAGRRAPGAALGALLIQCATNAAGGGQTRGNQHRAEEMLAKLPTSAVAASGATATPGPKKTRAAAPSASGASPGAFGASATGTRCVAEGVLDEGESSEYATDPTRRWRNWQTRQIQVLVGLLL